MPAPTFHLRAAIAALFVSASMVGTALVAPAFAHEGPHEPEASTEQQAATHTRDLLALMWNYARAVDKDKPKLAAKMQALIDKRQAALYAMVVRHPEKVMRGALPGALRAKLPASVAAAVEQEVDATGIVVGRVSDDFANGRSKRDFFLEMTSAGKTTRINIDSADASLSPDELGRLAGRQVKIRGLLLKDHLVVGHRRSVETLAAPKNGSGGGSTGGGSTGGDGSGGSSEPPAAAAVNETTLVLIGNFTDKTYACGGTQDSDPSGAQRQSYLTTRLFSNDTSVASMNRLYRETSRELVSFSGDVKGPFTIGYSAGGACDYTAWGNALKAAAQAAGVNVSSYRRVSYAIPSVGSCGWSGLAYLGGSFPTQSWVASCSTGVFAHELGHNLRFHHAATVSSEYGDSSDPMGNAPMVQFNASNRVAAGWQPSGTVVDADASGSYTITSTSNTAATGAQILRVRKADTSEYYYLSLRTGTGFDNGLNATYKDKVSVHRSNGALGSKTYFLTSLAAGGSYADAANGLSFSVQSLSGGGATVAVTSSAPPCTTAAPSVALSPATQSGAATQTRQYTATVTNRNGSTCTSSSFAMAQTVPGGFTGTFSPASLTLAPGASANVTWSVTPQSGTGDGSYTVTARANDSAAGGGSGSASGAYVVFTDSVAPTVAVTSPSNGAQLKRGRITLAASASDSDGVARVEFFANGTRVGTDSSAPYSVNWNARKAAPGATTITARAFDPSGNSSDGTITIQLQ